MKNMIRRHTEIPAQVVQFGRYLREHGFSAGPQEFKDLLNSFSHQVPTSFNQQQALYRAIFVKNKKQLQIFDELFESFWQQLNQGIDSKIKSVEDKKNREKKNAAPQAPSIQTIKNWLHNGRIEEDLEVATYSAFEALGKKDFSLFLTEDQEDLAAIIRIIARRMAFHYNRRFKNAKNEQSVDLKNTIRLALRKGGNINRFLFKKRQKKKIRINLICDVSKSMELYSQFLIEFMYHFQQAVFDLRTFVFSTRLVSLTRLLRDGDYEKVLNGLAERVPNWSGGTRIGQSLETFVKSQGPRLQKNAIVMILSDGWDTGDLDKLEKAMRQIRKKSKRVIWINPLAGNPGYSPDTQGMKICLPYIDVFTSAHNLDSLRAIAGNLRL